jgi:predicted GH43/DUF377 family glycosyl hydrolase
MIFSQKFPTISSRGTFFLILSFLLFVFSCDTPSEPSSHTPDFVNPLIKTGDFFADSNWNDPHVIHDGTRFVMYASAAVNFDENVKIYRLISDDGISWELNPSHAVLEKSASGWDSYSTETPAVVYYEGQYHLFYTGYSGHLSETQYFKIGRATSPDGIHWTKDTSFLLESSDPTGPVNLDFHQHVVAEPAPVVFNGKIYLYFTAMGASATVGTTWQTIGLTVFDGTSWSAPEKVLEPDLTLYPRSGYTGYSTPNAAVRDGKIHLYFDVVADPWKQVKLHHAVSADGITGWISDSAPLMNREDFSWTADEIRSPSALLHNGKLYLYFAGHTVLDLAIGLKIY